MQRHYQVLQRHYHPFQRHYQTLQRLSYLFPGVFSYLATMWLNKLKSLIRHDALPERAEPPRHSFESFKGMAGRHQPHPAGEFQQVLQEERRTADQTGQEFSLLVFEFNDNPPSDGLVQKLWQVIYRGVRRTDKVGWLSSQSIGIILPETPFADSRKVAEEVCRTLEAVTPLVSYKILTYPRRSL